MKLFSLFLRPGQVEALPVAVADGFSWPAFLFAPIWLLFNRLWLIALGFIALALLFVVAGRWMGSDAAVIAYASLSLLVGLEAAGLRRRALRHGGHVLVAERLAPDADAAAIDWLGEGEPVGARP
ncbi:MAG: DUF2628 domain-containing protein [Devosia sp.]